MGIVIGDRMDFLNYEEIRIAECKCQQILDNCKASEDDIKRIYENAYEIFFEVIDEFQDVGIIEALRFSFMEGIVNYINSVFDIENYVRDYDEFQLFVNGIDAREYKFDRDT